MSLQTLQFGSGNGTIGGATSLTPAPVKQLANQNYLSGSDYDFTKQYLPDLYEQEFERYGNRSVASFLRMVGAEIPSSSDLIKWSEQGRLHVQDSGTINAGGAIDGLTSHNFRLNQTIIISDGTSEAKALITAVNDDDIEVKTYATLSLVDKATAGDAAGPFVDDAAVDIFVYGSEFRKGTGGMSESLEASFESKENNPIIIKDKYEVSGSEMAHVGWVEVATENGASGYLWYLKSEHETRLRFEDYLEMSMVEGEPAAAGSAVAALTDDYKGTKGLFYEVDKNGNVGTGSITDRDDLEQFAKVLDKEGAIQENVLFVNRATSFDIDRVLASQNNGAATSATSYGLFDNDEDMALNLGFTGFRIGYDFYKTDWKYLNDATTRGSVGIIDGIMVPAGTTTVYDQVLGENAKRPFLHVRYRVSPTEDRKYKSWVVGSAGGASNSDKDSMEVHFLSERALCTMGVNNFILLK